MNLIRVQTMCEIFKNILVGFVGEIAYVDRQISWGLWYYLKP